MKIYYLSGTAIPSRAASTLHVMKIADAFAKNGHNVSVFAFADPDQSQEPFSFYGMPASFELVRFRLPKLRRGLGVYFSLCLLLYCLRQGRPDIFYGRHSQSLLAASLTGRPVAYEAHSLFSSASSRWVETLLFRRANFRGLVTISKALTEDYRHALPGLNAAEIWTIPDAADIPSRPKETISDAEWPGRPDAPQIGYVGHLYKGRGVEIIFALARSMAQCDFHIVGGRDRDVEKCKNHFTAPNLFYHGFVRHDHLNRYYTRFDAVLAPYQRKVIVADGRRDTARWMSPLKVFEYMSYGLPIVASDLPALREIFENEKTALLAAPDHFQGWKSALESLTKNPQLPRSIGQAAKQAFLGNYTWQQRARKIEDIFTQKTESVPSPGCDPNPRVWLLIPIEVKVREYHAKLLLSCVAAEAGFGVILGRKGDVGTNLRFLPRGILFGNNITTNNEDRFSTYRKMGYTVAAWCEEGIAYRNRRSYRHERVSPVAMGRVESFFAWGDYHARDVSLAVDAADRNKVVPAGNPRLDLLRPEFREFYRDEALRLQDLHGRVILVNTNFHRFNHFKGRGSYLQDLKRQGKVPDAEREQFFQQWIDFLGKMYHAFASMLPSLSAAFPKHTIIVRPHPSEDHDAWRKEVDGLANVKVLHEGSVLPWILTSEVMVHNSCSTGIEAFAMGVPVISYRPHTSKAYDAFLPNAVSREVSNEEELVRLITALTESGRHQEEGAAKDKRRLSTRFFSGLEGELASQAIVDALGRLDVPARPFAASRVQALAHEIAIKGLLPVSELLSRAGRGPGPDAAYLQQKFPSLTLSEVREDVDRLRKVSGRFADVNVSQIGKRLFRLTSTGE